jgi:hypothetical protein
LAGIEPHQLLSSRAIFFALLLIAITGSAAAAMAQEEARAANLPDAPIPKQQQTSIEPSGGTFKNTIGILGKRSVFFPELAHDKGPLDPRKKLELAIDDSLAPSRILGSLFTSGIGQARDALPGYGQGWNGYGKRFGSSIASNASSQMFGTFLLPSMLHEDPRYFVKGHGTPRNRILYAFERVVITRTDDGRERFNWSGVLGGLMAEGLANSYLPDDERTAGKTFSRYGVRVGFRLLNNVVKEYWPTIFKSLKITKFIPAEESDPSTVTPLPEPEPQR